MDDNFRDCRNTEKQLAIESAKRIASEIAVSEEAAVACAKWLERIVATPEDVQANDDVNSSFASVSSRKEEFIKRATAMQLQHDAQT